MDRCAFNTPLTEEELLAYIDDEADETTQNHLKQCIDCADKAARYKTLQTNLQRILYRQACPASQQLTDFETGLLNDSEQATIRTHLQECPHCRADIETLKTFLAQPENKPQPVPIKLPDLQIIWQIKQARHLIGKLVLSLANLSANTMISVPVKGQRQTGNVLFHFSVVPDAKTDIDATLTIYRQPNLDLCEVWIQALIPAEWPQLSNLQITLKSSTRQQTLVTDTEDKVVFTDIPLADIPQLSFEIAPFSN